MNVRKKLLCFASVIAVSLPVSAQTSAGENAVNVKIDFSSSAGPVKPMHGIGQPPMLAWDFRMFKYLKEAGIPFSRLHDVGGAYGKNVYVDIPNLFRDFDADESDPKNYNFEFTDFLLKAIIAQGVEPFFRLGVTIENRNDICAVNIDPPKDPAKWARICEHVIRHYTEGWAKGYTWKIRYWEIWNEPENHPNPQKNPMFRGPWSDYLKLYEVTSKHLKKCFPHLKIGGYASCGFYAAANSPAVAAANSSPRTQYFVECYTNFLAFVKERDCPFDFFSLHTYSDVKEARRQVDWAIETLHGAGFTNVETTLNEWLPRVAHENLGTASQASAVCAEILSLQQSKLDSAMIYDGRCGIGNYSPLFNPMTYEPHKAYYALKSFNELYRRKTSVACQVDSGDVWAVAAGTPEDGAILLANPTDETRPLTLDLGGLGVTNCRVTDGTRTDVATGLPAVLTPQSFLLVFVSRKAAAGEPVAANTDEADACQRTFVLPTRIVWQSQKEASSDSARYDVTGTGHLLGPKRGQIPETSDYAAKIQGCSLVNRGNAPGIILDFGKELHGGLQLGVSARSSRGMKLRIRFGESVAETLSDAASGIRGAGNDHAMRDLELAVPTMGTAEIGNSGFRFVRIDLLTFGTVEFESVRAIELTRPMPRLGAFRSSDDRLNRIFETAVRTVHLCCQNYIWDGIKRDRLVWMGDTHPETMTVLNVFGAAEVLPASLDYMAATTDAKTEWMNIMTPYTLWWVRNLADYYRFSGDRAYLAKHRAYFADTMNHLLEFVTPSNSFWEVKRPFLDWPTEHNRPAVYAGMQALATIAFRDGAFLAGELGDADLGAVCGAAAAKLASQTALDPNGAKSAAAMLALAGLRSPREMFDGVLGKDAHAGVSTFYGYYMLEAMSAAGANQRALDTVRDYWGAMLDVGATSFWEDWHLGRICG